MSEVLEAPVEAESAQARTIQKAVPMNRIVVGKYNPRRGKKAVQEMADSIRAQGGVMQRPLLRPVPSGDGLPFYELVYGQRRLLGARLVYGEEASLNVDVREMSEEEAIAASAAENIDRADISPIEEAEAAAKILAEFDGDRLRSAERMGWKPGLLDSRLKLMACSQAVRDAVVDDEISLGMAEVLAGLTKAQQDELLAAVLKLEKQPTIEELKASVLVHTRNLGSAIFDKTECTKCHHNSEVQGEMFGTFAGGYCLNNVCYSQKLDAELEHRATELRDTFPMVRVVRAGDQLTVRKLYVEGESGVGPEQAQACTSCANFGAAVSSIPEKLGMVSKNLCFSPSCNDEKISLYRQQREALSPQSGQTDNPDPGASGSASEDSDRTDSATPGGTAGTPASKASAKRAEPKGTPKPTVKLAPVVMEHRLALYRTVVAREILKAAERGNALLMALAATGKLRAIPEAEVSTVLANLTGAVTETRSYSGAANSVALRYKQVLPVDPAAVSACLAKLAATCVGGLDGNDLEELVKALNPDWKEHFKLDSEFLGKLTKVEITAIASDLGILKVLGQKADSLLSQKKDQLIATVLGVSAFDYQGAIPRVLLPGAARTGK